MAFVGVLQPPSHRATLASPPQVNANVKNLSILAVLLRVVGALIANKHLNSQLELYV